jgi:ATP/maltotriose-dependent transcriptional regulator MalT
MDVVRGWCLLDLGQPDGAVEALRSGLGRAPRTARRARALYGVRLALAHAVAGDTRQARETGTTALANARHVDSASVRHQLRALATVVRRWSERDGIRDFRMLIDCNLTPSRIHS